MGSPGQPIQPKLPKNQIHTFLDSLLGSAECINWVNTAYLFIYRQKIIWTVNSKQAYFTWIENVTFNEKLSVNLKMECILISHLITWSIQKES